MSNTIIRTSKTVDMDGTGYPDVEVIDDTVQSAIIISQDKSEIHLTREAAAVIAKILEEMGRS